MSYAVLHMQKFKTGDIKGIQRHNQREGVSNKNPDIDYSKSHKNIDLINLNGQINYNDTVKNTIRAVAFNTKTVRKDAVCLCNFIITSDSSAMKRLEDSHKLFPFFWDAIDFFKSRYGKDRIIYSVVHMDEHTPHMHLGIVPVDKNNRLSCKNIFTKTELTNLQTDFVKEVALKYGLERGEAGSQKTHLDEVRFKIQKENEKLKFLQKSILEMNRDLSDMTKQQDSLREDIKKELEVKETELKEIQQKIKSTITQNNEITSNTSHNLSKLREIESNIKTLQEDKLHLKSIIDALEWQIKSRMDKILQLDKINSMNFEKNFIGGGYKNISDEDIKNVYKTALNVSTVDNAFRKNKKKLDDITQKYNDLTDEYNNLYEHYKSIRSQKDETVNRLNKTEIDYTRKLREKKHQIKNLETKVNHYENYLKEHTNYFEILANAKVEEMLIQKDRKQKTRSFDLER
jgi:chromosome segregation ATPase